jgi:hypothetical protein
VSTCTTIESESQLPVSHSLNLSLKQCKREHVACLFHAFAVQETRKVEIKSDWWHTGLTNIFILSTHALYFVARVARQLISHGLYPAALLAASLGCDVDAWRKCRNASGVAFFEHNSSFTIHWSQ